MKQITATVTEQNLVITPSVLSVSESVNLYSLVITFDDEWDEVDTKVVTFKAPTGKAYAIEYDETDGATIPWEVLKFPGKVSVGVVGYVGTTQKLTTTGLYNRNNFVVLPAAFGLAEAVTPTPDIYAKLLQTIDGINTTIGDLSDLDTSDQSSIVAAINEVLTTAGVTEISDDTGESATGSVNIKTINGESLLGTGDIEIKGGGSGATVDGTTIIFDTSAVSVSGTTIIFEEA